ncbi:MAG: hypothetical protein RLZZ618_989 [Pseudomonadota bacterium]|jgi:NitT/TauT family transport system substrate-binding protein
MRLNIGLCRAVALRVATALVLLGALSTGHAESLSLDLAVSKGSVSLPIYVAQANGYFEREGVKVKLHECSSGKDCVRLLTEGQVSAATAAELIATLNGLAHPDLAYIASISASSHQIKLVARKAAGIALPSDIVGKRIGTVMGSSAQYFLSSWLLFHDIPQERVKIVPVAPDQAAAALSRGDIDVLSIWEPMASAAQKAPGVEGALLPNPRVYTQHFGLITTRRAVQSQEAALRGLLRALLSAERFIAEEPVKAREVLIARQGIPLALAQEHLREHDFRIRLDQALVSTMSSQRRWAAQEHLLPAPESKASAASVIEPALLRSLAPQAVTLVR